MNCSREIPLDPARRLKARSWPGANGGSRGSFPPVGARAPPGSAGAGASAAGGARCLR